jgi:hypothetical protein
MRRGKDHVILIVRESRTTLWFLCFALIDLCIVVTFVVIIV